MNRKENASEWIENTMEKRENALEERENELEKRKEAVEKILVKQKRRKKHERFIFTYSPAVSLESHLGSFLMEVFLWKQVQQRSYKIYDVHINC